MANPQKENGYTAISNEILEALVISGLNGTEFSIILCVIRRTYGFNKKEDWISYSQFEKFLGISRSNVWRNIESLVAKKILVAKKQPQKTFYSLNKDYSGWVVAKTQLVAKMRQTSCENETQLVANTQPTKDTLTKENIQKKGNVVFIKFLKWVKTMKSVKDPESFTQNTFNKYPEKLISKALNDNTCTTLANFYNLCNLFSKN